MIDVHEAFNIVMNNTKLLKSEDMSLINSLNRVLAEDISSKDNLPPFDKSCMDGYALKSEDTKEKMSKFRIKGSIKAGDFPDIVLKNGEAIKIMTGAPVPKGADAVIQIEKVKVEGKELHVLEKVSPGTNIFKTGEEIKIGDVALKKGKIIRPAEIGLLASLGYTKIKCYKAPKIIIINTGDELININQNLMQGKIRNCNEYTLIALIKNLNAEVKSYGIIRDDKNKIFNAIKTAFEEGDIIITTGGASVGDYDFIEDVLQKVGTDIKFTSVAIKPGKPVVFATFKDKLFFGLPGNPLSVINSFETFAASSIKKMMGREDIFSHEFPVILKDDFKSRKERDCYMYVDIKKEDNHYYAYDVGRQDSNGLFTLTKSNGVVIMKKGTNIAKAGDILNGKFIFK
ncbi:gephyrin-like molybdotransferase Glp [Clostridium sp. AWRP]|uniref:molybdopterin molybdotransferase MoeA n=1 Tax=Clostridium sp. AWRP TaxID=2212991 RepID=UPI000FDC1BDC|nr:gephyrin-like molybdotransferase Glp [Clostridium sp. AWRP]AZV55700.1 molybdopterin molybdotransferase MoeA [Clostridium sp. AWRP]